jgi:prevent-host-death family protein
MRTVNIHEAKTHLSRLIEEAVRGEPFIIAKAGKPLVQVSAIEPQSQGRRLGGLAHLGPIPDDFDTMFAKEIEEMFYGSEDEVTAGPEDTVRSA